MKCLTTILLLTILTVKLCAQEFNAKLIPDSLINNANVVKRYEEIVLEIKSSSKFILHKRQVFTILNEASSDYAEYRSYYDKFTTIDYASAVLYDDRGKQLKHIKKKEMPDFADIDGNSLVDDDRYIAVNFSYPSYPYTVDYEDDVTNDGVLFFPGWRPVWSPNMSVEYSKYVIVAPANYEVRYKQLNFSMPPVISKHDDKFTYTWEIKNVPAQIHEDLAPAFNGNLPYMMVAPSDFEAESFSGNMSTWENYGKFIYQLKKGRDVLPEDIKKQIHELTDNLKDPRQKINALYDFLQKNTHYISIQLGIGGWQPFDASYVATKKYGDCKALSNYMIALLKEVGINGKYVVIKASENARPIVKDFPDFGQFNHVICCVPLQRDTVWLECTSENKPAGYLGGFTADRYGLLVDENGGTLVHTPKYGYRENVRIRKINAEIKEDGNLSGSVETLYKAMEQDDLSLLLSQYSNDKVSEYLKNSINLPTYDIQNLHFSENKNLLPSVTATMDLIATNYAQVTGKRLFITANILTRSTDRFTEDKDRKYDIELHDERTLIDTVEIQIPSGYTVESPFHDISIESEFGKFKASAKITDGKIIYYRRQEYYGGIFPASDYEELVSYYQKIYKSDHSNVVLVKEQ
jgi:Domain of Unknown Function with PDB structure (DUF3857)/Transglutaminase-like superfamily